MNIINALTNENQATFNAALALLAQEGRANEAEALRAQLAGETRLVVKQQMRDWLYEEGPEQLEEGDGDPFDVEVDLDSRQPSIAFFRNGTLAGELRVEINKGTPAVHINTTEDSALAHVHFAQGGIVLVTDSPDVMREPATPDRYAYHEGGLLFRHQQEEWLLDALATDAFEAFDFGFMVSDAGDWTQDSPLHWLKTVHGETESGQRMRVSFHVTFDERYEGVVASTYTNDLETQDDAA